MDHICLRQAPILKNREEIIQSGGALFADSLEMEQELYQVLKQRDELADTYMKPFRALLLHGRSEAVSHPCFGYLRLEPPVYEQMQIIRGAIVTLIPGGENQNCSSKVVSETIGALLEEPALLKALQELDKEVFSELLEKALLKYYRRCVTEIIQESSRD